ncbi:hypothetical protein ACHAPU_010080 [Fusarium lateritium]
MLITAISFVLTNCKPGASSRAKFKLPILVSQSLTRSSQTQDRSSTTYTTLHVFKVATIDTTIKPFAGPNEPKTSEKFLSTDTSSRNEAVIVGGVVIGSVLLAALFGVAYMFYKKRVSKMKALEAKAAHADDFV